MSMTLNSAHRSISPLLAGVPVSPTTRLILGRTCIRALKRFTKAMQANDEAATAKAFTDFFANVEAKILKQAENFDTERADKALYAQRGLRVLSNAEEKFFKGFIDAAKSDDVQKALMDFSEVLPESEINAVFEDLAAEHPLLEAVDFQNTSALTKLIFDSSETQMAVWGELTSAITKELEGGVKIVELVLNKLTAFYCRASDGTAKYSLRSDQATVAGKTKIASWFTEVQDPDAEDFTESAG